MADPHLSANIGKVNPALSPSRWILLLAGTLLILFTSFFRIARPDVWIDEVYTFNSITATFPEHLADVYATNDHPPLFFHFGWIWARISHNLTFLRTLPALSLALGSILLLHHACHRSTRFTSATAILLAIALATSPILIEQAGNLRHYGLFYLLGMIYTLRRHREITRIPRPRGVISAILAGTLILTHHFGLFLIVGVEAGAFLTRRIAAQRLFHRDCLLRTVAFLPFAIAWLAIAWAQYPGSGGEKFALLVTSRGIPALINVIAEIHGADTTAPVFFRMIVLTAAFSFIGFDFFCAVKHRREPETNFWTTAAYFPVLLLSLLSFLTPAMASRFLIPSTGLILFCHARNLDRIPRSYRFAVASLYIGLCVASACFTLTREARHPAYSLYVPQLLRAVQPNEVLVLPPGSHEPIYRFYARRENIPLPAMISISAPIFSRHDYDNAIARFPDAVAQYPRAWVVYEYPHFWDPGNAVQGFFEASWSPGPYQELWGKRWVVTYYDNPELTTMSPD